MDKVKKEKTQPAPQTPKQPWRKPDLQKLRVSLDTASTIGSGGDGVGRTSLN